MAFLGNMLLKGIAKLQAIYKLLWEALPSEMSLLKK